MRETPVSRFFAVTTAEGTAAAAGSVTKPVMLAETCAQDGWAAMPAVSKLMRNNIGRIRTPRLHTLQVVKSNRLNSDRDWPELYERWRQITQPLPCGLACLACWPVHSNRIL